ncbi:MAG: co-chaperone GroES [Planctomycetota bacterium]
MKIEPLADKIVIKRLKANEITSGGIVLPETAKEKPQEGKVIAVGTGHQTDEGKVIPLTVKKGDKVLFTSYAGTEIKVDGEDYIVMPEEDILAVID